jgi:hypothetical protein
MAPNLGWIPPSQRTVQQHDLHAKAVGRMPRFALPPVNTGGPVKVMLSDFWHKPEVVAETGVDFDRAPFHQLTGSCVGAGGGNALYTLICVQRLLSDGATKAFVPFWPFSYGRCRFNEGDHGQGEGAMGSSFAETIAKEGVVAATEAGLPAFQNSDGYVLTERLEMQWSDGGSKPCTDYLDEANPHPLGSAAEMKTPQDMKTAILNGYPGSFACNNYIGKAAVSGDALLGRWDGSAGTSSGSSATGITRARPALRHRQQLAARHVPERPRRPSDGLLLGEGEGRGSRVPARRRSLCLLAPVLVPSAGR